MIVKTQGIVFRFIRYKETSVIVTVFTKKYGIQSYIVNGVRSKKPKIASSYFQPLTLLDLVVYHKEGASLNRISEIKCSDPYMDIPTNIHKSSVLLFLSEVLYKSIKHESHPEVIFHFMYNSLLSLENLISGYENFHIQFLLKLTKYLGFQPDSGSSLRKQLLHQDSELELPIDHFLKEGYNTYLSISNKLRSALIHHILEFYHLHIEGFGKIQSTQILHEIIKKVK